MSIDRQKVIDTAQKYAAKGQFDKAIVEYMRIVKEDPTDVRVLLKIGDLQVRRGAKEDAIATYSRVASGYDQQGFFLKAIAVYKQILSIDPNLTELYAKLADLYVKLGLIPDALAHLDALGSRYARAGQDDKVVGVLAQMTQVDPTNVPCHIKLAELLSRLGKNEDAAREFEAGGNLLKEAGRQDDWAKVAERLLFHRPNDTALARDLAAHYLSRQDAKRALPKLQVCFKANAKDVDTLELLASAFRELGQLPKTISVLKEIARIHGEAGHNDRRAEMYRRVLELAPNDAEAKDALRGSSRMSRRPSAPAMPAATAPATNPRNKSSQPNAPVVKMPPATAAPVIDDEEDAEEIVVEDSDEDAVYDLKPSAAKPRSIRPPPSAAPAQPPRAAVQAAPVVRRAPVAAPPPAPSVPVRAHADLGRLVGEADIFLKYGLRQKAIGHLSQALEIEPGNIDVHARLRDLFHEMGDVAGMARHAVQIADLLSESQPDVALAEVTQILQIDPAHEEALALYQRLVAAAEMPAVAEDDGTAVFVPPDVAELEQGYGGDAPSPGPEPRASRPDGVTARDIEEGLDEAEFFVTQGLHDEARDTLQQLLAAHPGHRLVIERVEELEAMLQAQAMPGEDQSFALAEKLAEEVSNVAHGGAQFHDGGEMIDVETVFAQFKRGVERTVGPDDAETHYDLGIAYKEMGLTEDAVSEFRIAAQNPRKACLADTMVGLCYLERGDVATAIEHLKRALQAPQRTDREEIALYFELGSAYEAVGDLSEAMYFFQKVEKRDPTFRGVKARVARLAAHVNSGTRAQPAQSADMDEVDRAFDELLKG